MSALRLVLAVLLSPIAEAMVAGVGAWSVRGILDPAPFIVFYFGTLVLVIVIGIPIHRLMRNSKWNSLASYSLLGFIIPSFFTIVYFANTQDSARYDLWGVHLMGLLTAAFAKIIVGKEQDKSLE